MANKQKKEATVSVNSINPVDFYNKYHIEDCIDKICEKPAIVMADKTHLSYVKNITDQGKRMLRIDRVENTFTAITVNNFNITPGEVWSPFMMLQAFYFKNNWEEAVNYVIVDVMKNDANYIRVGTKYYKKSFSRDRWGVNRLVLQTWDRQTLVDDYGRDFLPSIPKFIGFTMRPDNKNYTRFAHGFYNRYHPFDHKPLSPKEYKGEHQWNWTKKLIMHIFGESDSEYELGIRYLKVLYDHPTQTLPILVLISNERQTGKTTFVNYMNMLFGANTVIINPQDISNQFNASYADKNVIMIEESHFESRQALEKIKNLSTQKELLVNTKHVSQYSVPFYGKLIITSNDENKFSKIDEEEIRYWVRKIPTLKGKANHSIMDVLAEEIPAFLAYLNTLPDVDRSKDRMVFTAEEIETDALISVKEESKSQLCKDLMFLLDDHAMNNDTVAKFYFTGKNLKDKWFNHNNNYGINYVNKVLKDEIKLRKLNKNKRFVPLEEGGSSQFEPKIVGKPFVYENPYCSEISLSNDDDDDQDDGDNENDLETGVPF